MRWVEFERGGERGRKGFRLSLNLSTSHVTHDIICYIDYITTYHIPYVCIWSMDGIGIRFAVLVCKCVWSAQLGIWWLGCVCGDVMEHWLLLHPPPRRHHMGVCLSSRGWWCPTFISITIHDWLAYLWPLVPRLSEKYSAIQLLLGKSVKIRDASWI